MFFLVCRLRIWNPFSGVGIGNPIFNRKRQWGTRGESAVLGGGGKPKTKQIWKKSQKSAKSKKKNRIFFLLKMV